MVHPRALMLRRVPVRLAIVLVLLAGSPLHTAAAPVDLRLRDYVHTVWTNHDGKPLTAVARILQTSDGYLWVFRFSQILRFDGVRFVPLATPCTELITSMTPANDGGFWVLCGARLLKRTADARLVVVSEALSKFGPEHAVLEDRAGRAWILGELTRYVRPDGTVSREVAVPGHPRALSAVQDSDGTIWVTDRSRVFHLHDDRAEVVHTLDDARCLLPSRDGGVLVLAGEATASRVWHLRTGKTPSPIADVSGIRMATPLGGCMGESEDGSLWLAAQQNVVALVRAGHVETLAETGQWERASTSVFIDHQGAIWVGTTSGVHRFRKPTVRFRAPIVEGTPRFVFTDSHRQLWTGTSLVLHRSDLDDGAPTLTLRGTYNAIGEDQNGIVWLSNREAIGQVIDGKFVPVADALGAPVTLVYAFQRDEQGHLWAVSQTTGVYQVTPGPPRLVAASKLARSCFVVSRRSGIWIALQDGNVEQQFGGRTHTHITPLSTIPMQGWSVMLEDGDSIWLGSINGLLRMRNGTWTAWTPEHGLPGDGMIRAIVPNHGGSFWMMTGGGLLRLSRAQLDATPDGHPQPLSFARIGLLDGIVPHPTAQITWPPVTTGPDGRLFFTTYDAIAVVDTAMVSAPSIIPSIVLESAIIDNETVDQTSANRFVEPSRLQFEFTALHLHSPELAVFRYRIEGHDANWIEAGAERRVTYGTLRPGAYRFRVIGAGSEGVWNDTGASFAFEIVPVFWRTRWFQFAVVVLGLSIAGGVYRLRIRQLTRQFNVGLEARVGERTRIARELHDTLLQSFQGALIHFQAATNLLPGRASEARQRFETALEQAARAVTEGRDAVQALRESAGASDDLPQALSALAEQLVDAVPDHPATIRVNVEGSPRSLRPIVRDEVYRIASEAIRNAARHAQARLIRVDIHYDARQLQLRIRDDGTGIDAAILDGRGVSGHWGLPGMRERTELIGGRLDVRSRVGAGTEVELSLPAAKAYAAAPGRRRFRRRWQRTDARS